MRKERNLDLNIKRFSEFIKESKYSIKEYDLDARFPWTEEISNLIDDIEKKVEHIKDVYNYEHHSRSGGFEFNIKIRNWPDFEELSTKYNITEKEIQSIWDLYLEDNLKIYADDIIEMEDYFTDWYQEGRSGGWLVLKHSSYVIDNPEDLIKEKIDSLNNLSYGIEDSEIEEWKEFKEKSGAGLRLLQRLDLDEGFEDIKEVEEESNNVKDELKEILKQIDGLEKYLSEVQKRIENFQENSQENFEEHLKKINDF